jgi:hypothetical protein
MSRRQHQHQQVSHPNAIVSCWQLILLLLLLYLKHSVAFHPSDCGDLTHLQLGWRLVQQQQQ